MSAKILVIDDSLTIQKVIGITLANSGHEIKECLNEADLDKNIQSQSYDLVLLDFNLSEKTTGYDLAIKIKSKMPKAGLVVMLGTFDSVDESRFDEVGINDKIIKPFESAKFIKKINDLLEQKIDFIPNVESFKVKNLESPLSTIKNEQSSTDQFDAWTLDAPKREEEQVENDFTDFDEDTQEFQLDPLHSEIQGWGFVTDEESLKKISLEDKFKKEFPPKIEVQAESNQSIVDIFQINEAAEENLTSQKAQSVIDDEDLLNKFDRVSKQKNNIEKELDLTSKLSKSLIEEIENEIKVDSFWALDEVTPIKPLAMEPIAESHLEEVTADLTETFSKFKEQQDFNLKDVKLKMQNIEIKDHAEEYGIGQKKSEPNINMDELAAMVAEKLKKSIMTDLEKMVASYCQDKTEKVAWEIIPDLAENLIKKELKDISESVK